jgi:hypothetical protein
MSDSVSSRSVAIRGYKFVRNDRTVCGGPGVGGGGVGLYIRNELGFKMIARSSEAGVQFLPPNTRSTVNRL